MLIKAKNLSTLRYDQPSLTPSFWPDPHTCISRDTFGNIASIYSDDAWDLSTYCNANKGDTHIHFNRRVYRENIGLKLDVKHLLHTIKEHITNERDYFSANSHIKLARILHQAAMYCADNGIYLSTLLSHKKMLTDFTSNFCSNVYKSTFSNSLRALFQIHPEIVGCNLAILNAGDYLEDDTDCNTHQTLVIPSRILSECIKTCQLSIKKFLSKATSIRKVVHKLHKLAQDYNPRGQNYSQAKISDQEFFNVVNSENMTDFLAEISCTTPIALCKYIESIQFACKTLFHIYSGTRDDEPLSMQRNCFQPLDIDGNTGYWLYGKVSKGYPEPTPAAWVTSPEIKNAFKAARRICGWMMMLANLPSDTPLFSSVNHFAFAMAHNRTKPNKYGHKLANLTHFKFNSLFDNDAFIITKDDIKEVQFIEYARNWDIEKTYIEGNKWNFTTHQFRRSLAYYGIESGLVRLSSLYDQLQHIRMQMTVHYTKGGAGSGAIIGDSPLHFQHELKRVSHIVKGLDYVQTLLMSEEKLIGGHGNHIERNIKVHTNVYTDRAKTVELVMKGLIAFRAHALGGCMSKTACHKHLIHPMSACIQCPDGAVIPSRVRLAMSSFETFMAGLKHGSPEYNTALHELELTTAALKKQNAMT